MRIQNTSVTGQVVEYLRRQIASGAWAVGDKLPSENQLIVELGVSRASVRSALQYFIGLGILKSYQGKGTFLVDDGVDAGDVTAGKITAEDCRDIYKVLEFRRMLEPQVCKLAVKHAGDDVADALEYCLETMKHSRGTENAAQFVQSDLQFHETICLASENPLAIKSLCRVFKENLRNHEQLNALFGPETGIRFHSAILDAFRRRDAEGAADLMARHIQEALDRLEKML